MELKKYLKLKQDLSEYEHVIQVEEELLDYKNKVWLTLYAERITWQMTKQLREAGFYLSSALPLTTERIALTFEIELNTGDKKCIKN